MTLHQLSDLFRLQQGEHLEPFVDLFIRTSDEELLEVMTVQNRVSGADEYLVEILVTTQSPVQPDSSSSALGELETGGVGQERGGNSIDFISSLWHLLRIGNTID